MAVPVINGTPVAMPPDSAGPSAIIPLFSTTGAGHVVVVVTINEGDVTAVTATGLTFTRRGTSPPETVPETGNHIETWVATSAGALSARNITVSAAGATFLSGVAFGVGGATGFDANASLPDVGLNGNRTVSTTSAETMVFAAFRYGGTDTPTAPTNWTLLHGEIFTGVFYRTFTSAQTGLSCPDGGTGAGDNNGGIADAFAASSDSTVTKTPTTGHLSLGGLLATHNAFSAVRIRDVLINESGQPIANATNIHLAVWYGGACRGAPDVSLNAQTTQAAGTTSWSIPTGTLTSGTPIFYVAQDSLSFSNYTAARMTPSYEAS